MSKDTITLYWTMNSGAFRKPETKIPNWPFGPAYSLAEYNCEGEGSVQITDPTDGDKVFVKPKKEIRAAKKKGWVYKANGYDLVITPISSWKKLGTKSELEEQRREALLRTAIM